MARNKPVQDDPAFEIAFLENVLRRSPDFIEAIAALAELCTRQGMYARGLELDQRLARLRPDDPVVQYNLACSLSLTGDVSGALVALKHAIRNGYGDFAHLEHDRDLVNLLADQGFQDFYRGLKSMGLEA